MLVSGVLLLLLLPWLESVLVVATILVMVVIGQRQPSRPSDGAHDAVLPQGTRFVVKHQAFQLVLDGHPGRLCLCFPV